MAMDSIRKFYHGMQQAGRGTILALDSGARWIGVAVSDDQHCLALPQNAFRRDQIPSFVTHIAQLMETHGSTGVVMGLPLRLSGGMSRETQRAKDLAQSLHQELKVPILLWDERFSSEGATRLMSHSPTRRKNGTMRHSIAAAWILDAVLQRLRTMEHNS